jgi:RNA polymerase sigma-70 factor (ECF subfamily)
MSSDKDIDQVMSRMLDSYGNTLLRLCFLYLKDVHIAEDALQDTFMRIYTNYGKFCGKSSEKTWVTRIAINVCKNYLRNPWRNRVNDAASLESIPMGSSEEGATYDGGLEAGANYDGILVEIMKLPDKYKDIILLYYYQEMKIREIAELLVIPETTVSTRLGRARGMLKKRLGEWYYD